MDSIQKLTEDLNLGSKIRIPEKVSEIILQYVKENNLQPGDKLPSENQLSQTLSVSSRSIREAMKILQARGFIEILQGKGVFLIDKVYTNFLDTLTTSLQFTTDIETLIFNLIEVRKIIEASIIESVALNRTEDELNKLEEIIDNMDKATEKKNVELYNSYDVAFHKHIIDCGKNNILIAFYNVLIELIFESFKKTGYKGLKKEEHKHAHRQIFNAIRDKDAQKAKLLNSNMINETEKTWRDSIQKKD